MKIDRITENIALIDVAPPIPGWTQFIGTYGLIDEYIATIDVGPRVSAGNLIECLKALRIDPHRVSHILLTHIHLDHAGAIGELIDLLPHAVVVVHPKGAPHLIDTGKLWDGSLKTNGSLAQQQGRPQDVPAQRVLSARDGMRISLGERMELEVIHTPGHAAHHMSFLNINDGMLFAGEAGGIFNESVDFLRPATPPPLRLEHTMASIDRLLEYGPKSICYSHFGFNQDAHSQLLREREQLNRWQEIIAEHLRQEETDPESILSELIKRDPCLEGFPKLPEAQRRRERYFMTNNVKGFIGYLNGNTA